MKKEELVFQGSDRLKVSLSGRFVLEKKINPSKIKKFHVTNIPSEVPYGKSEREYFKNDIGQPLKSLLINKIFTHFDPDRNVNDLHNVKVLMNHSNVRIESMTAEEHRKLFKENLKVSNPQWILKNIDKAQDEEFERENLIYKVQNMIRNDGQFSSKQLNFICSALDIPYSIKETFEDSKKNALIRKISKWSNNFDNAKKLEALLEDINEAEYIFYINNLMRFELIVNKGGLYKFHNDPKPIGASQGQIIDYFKENREIYDFWKVEVVKLIKQEKDKN